MTLADAIRNMKQLPATLSVSLLLLVEPFFGGCCGMASVSPRKADLYVSTDGSDDWSGSLPEPNAKGTDGPCASLKRARDAVRKLKLNPDSS